MLSTGDRVVAREDLEGDIGDIVKGETGIIVGRRGDDYVVRFATGTHAVVPGRLLTAPREGANGARQKGR